jgi:glycerol-3-phosphate dehydrogenase
VTRDDIELHYSGVRPLAFVPAGSPAAITRRHALHVHGDSPVLLVSVIGGKLTTCRSLAESAAAAILPLVGRQVIADSRERMLPGGEGTPRGERFPPETVEAASRLLGAQAEAALRIDNQADRLAIDGTPFPAGLARWMIRHEWVRTLDDLVERRLMLLYHRVTRVGLRQLAALLVEEGRIVDIETSVAATVERLERHYGKRVV